MVKLRLQLDVTLIDPQLTSKHNHSALKVEVC